jgi:hypothetical protein
LKRRAASLTVVRVVLRGPASLAIIFPTTPPDCPALLAARAHPVLRRGLDIAPLAPFALRRSNRFPVYFIAFAQACAFAFVAGNPFRKKARWHRPL